jgi:hypothetical protein
LRDVEFNHRESRHRRKKEAAEKAERGDAGEKPARCKAVCEDRSL